MRVAAVRVAWVGVLLAAALEGCGSAGPVSAPPDGSVPAAAGSVPGHVDVAEAARLRDAGAVILDVREPQEWAEVHIPGAVLIPLGELPARVRDVPAGKDVVVVCRSGSRSQKGRDVLLGAGVASVTSMDGGVMGWQAAGLPVERGQ